LSTIASVRRVAALALPDFHCPVQNLPQLLLKKYAAAHTT